MNPRGPTATKSSAKIRPSVSVSPRNSAAAQSSPSLSSCPLCSCISTSSEAPSRFYRGVYERTFAAGSEDRRGFRVTNVIAGFGRVALPLPARAGAEPVADLGPEALFGAAAGHEADVAGVEDEELLVLAADEVHRGFGLRGGADMVLLASDVEERDLYVGEVDAAAPEDHLTPGQLVLLIELRDPLPERRAREGRPVVDPLVHREPGLHRLLLEDALPHVDVGANVVGHGL